MNKFKKMLLTLMDLVNLGNKKNKTILVENVNVTTNIKEKVEKIEVTPYMERFINHNNNHYTKTFLKYFNVPLEENEYIDLFKSLINEEKFIHNENNYKILTKIYDDVKKINDKLLILNKLRINYVLDVTGGCVRDFILDKEIKDVDIMLSLKDDVEIIKTMTSKDLIEVGFSEDSLKKVSWDNLESDVNVKEMKLLQLCFENNYEKVYINNSEESIEENMIQKAGSEPYWEMLIDRLSGVLKMNMSTSYPVDILVTNLSKYQFMNEFDINLCKASFCFKNSHVSKDFPKNPQELLSRFSAPPEFFADIYNKKLTINVNKKGFRMLDAILDNHLPRVQEKYPDYNVNILSYLGERPQYLSYATKKILEKEINNKEKDGKKLKI